MPSNIDKTPPSTAGRQVIGRRLSLSRRVNRTFSKFIANASSSYARMSGTRGDGEPNKLSQHPQVDIEDANDANSTNHLIKQSAVPKLPSIHSNGVGNEDSRLSQITLPGGKRKTTLPGIFMSSSSMDDQICEIPIDTFRVKEKSRKADSLSNSKSSQLDLFQRRQNASNGLCKASGRFALVRCEKSSLDLTPLNDGIVAQTVLSRQEQPRNSLG